MINLLLDNALTSFLGMGLLLVFVITDILARKYQWQQQKGALQPFLAILSVQVLNQYYNGLNRVKIILAKL